MLQAGEWVHYRKSLFPLFGNFPLTILHKHNFQKNCTEFLLVIIFVLIAFSLFLHFPTMYPIFFPFTNHLKYFSYFRCIISFSNYLSFLFVKLYPFLIIIIFHHHLNHLNFLQHKLYLLSPCIRHILIIY